MVGVGNRTTSSKVWAHFQKLQDGGKCNICACVVKGKGGNTSNLEKHVRLKHGIILKQCALFNRPLTSIHNQPDGSDQSKMDTQNLESKPSSGPEFKFDGPPLPNLHVATDSQESIGSQPLKNDQNVPSIATVTSQPEKGQKRLTQYTLPELTKPKKPKLSANEKSAIGRAITRYIVKDMLPFSTISSETFRHLLVCLNPEFTPPNKETLSSVYIPAWYEVEVAKLKHDLIDVTGIGITADHWTSLSGDHYLTVTAQYVKDWSLHSKVLQTKAVYESQTGEAIEYEIRSILIKFGILEKVVGITVDNAANMAVCARLLGIVHLPCFAHSMNIAASKLYNETSFTRWLARIRSIVLWFKRVHMAGVVLKEKLKFLDLPNHSVVLDVKTRWNSMYLMVDRFAEIYPGLSAACRDQRLKQRVEKEKVERVTDGDLKKAEEFIETMNVLYTSTNAMSTDKLPTVGQVLPTWRKLEKVFTIEEDDSDFRKLVKATVWKDMQKRYQDPATINFLEEASALDPRFKKKIAGEDVWGRLESKVAELIQEEQAKAVPAVIVKQEPIKQEHEKCELNLTVDSPETPDIEETDTKPIVKCKKSAIEELFSDDEDEVTVTGVEPPPSPQFLAHSEIVNYRAMPKLNVKECPLEFYKDHKDKFPNVAILASRYFGISGSSVPAERVFSLAGNTISQERVRIDPDKADMLIFLNKNAD